MTRPLSPHLRIYRWEITMVLSILHRITGVVLWGVAVVLLVWTADSFWLHLLPFHTGDVATQLMAGDDAVHYILLAGMAVMVFCLAFHGLNGLRHLLWDCGLGYQLHIARGSAWLVMVLSLLLTVFFIYTMIGQ